MKMKKLALATAICAASSVSFQAMATCPAGATCETDANGSICTGSLPVGIVIDKDIRDNLQSAMFSAASICNPANGNYAAFGESRTCMPGISTAEFNGIAAGLYATWAGVADSGSTNNLKRCGFNSGTYFGAAALNYASNGGNISLGETAEASVAAVETCMVPVVGSGKTPGSESIGVLPVDTTPTADYRFIKLDGAAPILAEHTSANYNLIANVAGGTFTPGAQSFGAVGGDTAANGAPVKVAGANCLDVAPAAQITAIVADTPR